jgi:hypothetical protein
VKKIEKRTEDFIREYSRLKKERIIKNNAELIDILGIKTVSTITEIIKRRQNITPDAWDKFKRYYKITDISVFPIFSIEEEITMAATVKTIINELIKIKSKVFDLELKICAEEMEQNTKLLIRDIFREKGLKQ